MGRTVTALLIFIVSIYIFLSMPVQWQNSILRAMQSVGSSFQKNSDDFIQRNEVNDNMKRWREQ